MRVKSNADIDKEREVDGVAREQGDLVSALALSLTRTHGRFRRWKSYVGGTSEARKSFMVFSMQRSAEISSGACCPVQQGVVTRRPRTAIK